MCALLLAIAWKDGANRFKTGAFGNDFSNCISLVGTGQEVDTGDGLVPVYPFMGVPARMHGLEQ